MPRAHAHRPLRAPKPVKDARTMLRIQVVMNALALALMISGLFAAAYTAWCLLRPESRRRFFPSPAS
ncbi:hypothetical protein Pen01_24370 [Phytomonospora endophytica]|nr:hypothetical protein Pen01_24370 [Phytomonospora endophytica]